VNAQSNAPKFIVRRKADGVFFMMRTSDPRFSNGDYKPIASGSLIPGACRDVRVANRIFIVKIFEASAGGQWEVFHDWSAREAK